MKFIILILTIILLLNCTNVYSETYTNNIPQYCYKARVVKVIDGDTVEMLVDLGFSVSIQKRFRLYGINAPELKNDTNSIGKISKQYLTQLINNKDVIIKTEKNKTDKYGRYIATIFLDNVNINQKIVSDGQGIFQNYK